MDLPRRALLAIVGSSVTVGCVGDGGEATPTPDGSTQTPPGEDCDPEDVERPPVVEDGNHPPQGYGTKPMELTAQSVADYLADFETAYAWNRMLDEQGTVASINVDTTTAWTPEAADDGFLASSRIETAYSVEADDDPTTRAYVASYFVAEEPVYRAESEDDAVDPRTHASRQLVQCGSDDSA